MIMSFRSIAGFVFWFVLTSVAFGQQKGESQTNKGTPQTFSESTIVRSYPGGTVAGSKLVRTRTESEGREIITEIFQVPGTSGRFETAEKTTTETVGIGSDSVKVKREVLGNGAQGRLLLIERSDIDQQEFPDGTFRIITNTWIPDLSGHLNLSFRQIQETQPAASDAQQMETTLYRPGINEALTLAERVRQTERRVTPDLIQTDIQHDVRDVNGQWQTIETRHEEVRTIGPAEVVEEESIRSLDGNGRLTLSDRTITRRSRSNGSDQVLTEAYSNFIQGLALGPGSPLVLVQRVRVTKTPTMSGGSQTITETESRAPGVSDGPIRVVARRIETVRQIGPDLWETQRQTLELDGSGRLVLTIDEKEETIGK
jgi:hypothetical protein